MTTNKKGIGKKIAQRIAILFIYAMCACDTMIELTLGDMSAAFPDASSVMINMVANFHCITLVIACVFIVPRLAQKFDNKKLVLLSMLGYGIFGMMGAFYSPNIYVIMVEQLFFGFTMAFAAPLSLAYVNALYTGMDRENMTGWSQTVSSAVAVGITMLAGVLCAINWRYTFLCYVIFVVAVILMLVALPPLPPERMDSSMESLESGKTNREPLYTPKQKIKMLLMILFTITILIGIVSLNIKLSILVEERNLGTAVVTAAAKSMNTVGTLIFSAFYGVIQKYTKRFVFHVGLLTTGIGCFVAAFAYTPFLVILGFFLAGGGMGISAPAIYSKVAVIGSPRALPQGMGIINAFFGLGMFLSSFFEIVVGIFVDATPTNVLIASGILFMAVAVIVLIYFLIDPLKGTDYVPPTKQEAV